MKKKIVSILISATLFATFSPAVQAASGDPVSGIYYITKSEAKEMAVANSNALKSLETSRQVLLGQLADYNDQMEGYDQVYTIYQDYEKLLSKYNQTQGDANKKAYFDLNLAMPVYTQELATLQTQLSNIPVTDPLSAEYVSKQAEIAAKSMQINEAANTLEALKASNGGPLTTSAISQIMTLTEYYTMLAYEDVLSAAGIDGNLSREEEYETFVYPINIVPRTFNSGVRALELGKQIAEVNIENGVIQLYNGLLALQGYQALLSDSYDLSKEQVRQTIARLQVGRATQLELDIAQNKEKIAALDLQNMKRQSQSMMMNMKQLIGLTYDSQIILEDKTYTIPELKTLSDYIDSALSQRNEIQSLTIASEDASFTLGYLDNYYQADDDEYLIQAGEVAGAQLDIDQQKAEIRLEITAAYQDVQEKKSAYDYSLKELQDAKDQKARLQRYYDLGYVTKSTLLQIDILIVQKENASLTAHRNYITALNQLEAASQFGPAYTLQ